MKFLHSLRLGIKRHPLKFFASILATYSIFWTLIESTVSLLKVPAPGGWSFYGGLVLFCFILACINCYPPRTVTFKFPGSNTKATVSFGDIFSCEGYIAIPVNEYFDSELGEPVSSKSLHGIVIERFFGGHPAGFDQQVSEELAEVPNEHVARKQGKTSKYPIGTSASIRTTSHRFILFALCSTNIETCKASTTVPNLVLALESLCAKAREVLGGHKLAIPLVSSGVAGSGLPPAQLLELILLVLANESKKNQFALELEVFLHLDKYDEVDLSMIHALWS